MGLAMLIDLLREKLKVLNTELYVVVRLDHYKASLENIRLGLSTVLSVDYEYRILYKNGSFTESTIEIIIWKKINVEL